MPAAPEQAYVEHDPEPFIPPLPERAEARSPRMPRIEDFPIVAQQQFAARSADPQEASERRGPGLLRRLANGLSRRDDSRPAPLRPAA